MWEKCFERQQHCRFTPLSMWAAAFLLSLLEGTAFRRSILQTVFGRTQMTNDQRRIQRSLYLQLFAALIELA